MKDTQTDTTDHDDIELTGEDVNDDIELEDVENNAGDSLKKLRTKLKECEKEKLEHLENLQRAKAEFLNAKKRIQEQESQNIARSINAHIEKLLPMCDSFQMAMSDTQAWESIDDTWRKGVESIFNQLQSILTSYDILVINPTNEPFNPTEHEAMTTIDTDESVKPETVVQVLQYGYKRNDELIRPAKVILSN
ncbi:MAG: molecular chaperone GrpE [Candidatus Azotimanducaceae bacterium]|jgi:molecular chaperone GrpE